jgi:hypothetical protein
LLKQLGGIKATSISFSTLEFSRVFPATWKILLKNYPKLLLVFIPSCQKKHKIFFSDNEMPTSDIIHQKNAIFLQFDGWHFYQEKHKNNWIICDVISVVQRKINYGSTNGSVLLLDRMLASPWGNSHVKHNICWHW